MIVELYLFGIIYKIFITQINKIQSNLICEYQSAHLELYIKNPNPTPPPPSNNLFNNKKEVQPLLVAELFSERKLAGPSFRKNNKGGPGHPRLRLVLNRRAEGQSQALTLEWQSQAQPECTFNRKEPGDLNLGI